MYSIDYCPLTMWIVGDPGVGKTCLWSRYMKGVDCTYNYLPNTEPAQERKQLFLRNIQINLTVCDTSGYVLQENRHGHLQFTRTTYTRFSLWHKTNLCMVAFDLTDKASFDNVDKWIQCVRRDDTDPVLDFVIVGLKSDEVAKRAVPCKIAQRLADSKGVPYFEISARYSKNLDEAFQALIELKLDRLKIPKPEACSDDELGQNDQSHSIQTVKDQLNLCSEKFNTNSFFYVPRASKEAYIREILIILSKSKYRTLSERAEIILYIASLSFSQKRLFTNSADAQTSRVFTQLAQMQLDTKAAYDSLLQQVTYRGRTLDHYL